MITWTMKFNPINVSSSPNYHTISLTFLHYYNPGCIVLELFKLENMLDSPQVKQKLVSNKINVFYNTATCNFIPYIFRKSLN